MDSIKLELKRLQNEFNHEFITCIEDLSSEIFYEIFDYLDGCRIYQAFSNLNYRFYQLLNSSSLSLKLKIDESISEKKFRNAYKQIYLHNKDKILSIHLSISNNKQILSTLNINSSFLHLQSLFFYSIQPEFLQLLLPKLISLPYFFSLTINLWYTLKELNKIYQLIFQLPKLKYMNFTALKSDNFNITTSLSIAQNNQFSPIEYLVINHPCTFYELFLITSYTPQVYRLNCMDINIKNLNIIENISLVNLKSLYIDLCDIKFNQFEIFISKICSKLEILSVSTVSNDLTYLNSNRWEELILKYQPNLKKFYLKYSEKYDNDYEPRVFEEKNNQFLSSFWIERQWVFETEIQYDELIYSIRPYKKRWYDHDIESNIFKAAKQCRAFNRFILVNSPNEDGRYGLSRMIGHIPFISYIFHLEILEEISFSSLIDTFITFLFINTLRISSLKDINDLSIITEKVRDFFIEQSRVTKIYLEKLNDIEEIYLLMKFYPRMIYLKVKQINNMDTESFIRKILKKIQDESNEQFRVLCFHIPSADDQILQKFDKMIQLENLLFNYTIKRVCENIYLQWK